LGIDSESAGDADAGAGGLGHTRSHGHVSPDDSVDEHSVWPPDADGTAARHAHAGANFHVGAESDVGSDADGAACDDHAGTDFHVGADPDARAINGDEHFGSAECYGYVDESAFGDSDGHLGSDQYPDGHTRATECHTDLDGQQHAPSGSVVDLHPDAVKHPVGHPLGYARGGRGGESNGDVGVSAGNRWWRVGSFGADLRR